MRKKARGAARSRLGTCLLLIGLLLILGAGGLVTYNLWDSNRAAEASREISEQLLGLIPLDAGSADITDTPEPVSPEAVLVEQMVEADTAGTMPTMEIDGYSYIGLLEIASLELSLPVMDTWDEERLKISPCLYAGSYMTDDMVVCAHNYIKHFSSIRWIEAGASVDFTAVDGTVYHYVVAGVETLDAMQVAEMIQTDSGAPDSWDLTLFTCNTGGQTRCAVRCNRVDSE